MMKKTVLITGGAKSGKSDFALGRVASGLYENRYFIATAEPLDEEMEKRIEEHRKQRSHNWVTLEEPIQIWKTIQEIDTPYTVAIVDCLTLWVSNLLMKEMEPARIHESFLKLLETLKGIQYLSIYLITNEVGMGIVPDNKMARIYRDLLGQLNQRIAKQSDEVYLLVSGIALKIK